ERVGIGQEPRVAVIAEEEKKTTADQEGGHALVARFLPGTDAVNKITIIPRGRSIGITWFLPEENEFKHKAQLESQLSVAFGGRAAEEIVFGRISTGAADDISQATELARKMVCAWGMSAALGPLSYAQEKEQIFLGREIAQHRDYSEQTAQKIDEEIESLIGDSCDRARKILNESMDILHKLAELLLEKETVTGSELDDLIRAMRPGIELSAKIG
ncbi:MAG: cell division protein FtsH, partial [Aestuariibacter sp.]|nr:cell division protein FtsH [Aestuariibacter sp.]